MRHEGGCDCWSCFEDHLCDACGSPLAAHYPDGEFRPFFTSCAKTTDPGQKRVAKEQPAATVADVVAIVDRDAACYAADVARALSISTDRARRLLEQAARRGLLLREHAASDFDRITHVVWKAVVR